MDAKAAYNIWADNYDMNLNKTRDLEAVSLRKILSDKRFGSVLEIGCGTGKNTEWLLTKSNKIVAIDFSSKMLEKARLKVQSDQVDFIQSDINKDWEFSKNKQFDLVVFSLVLEHIADLTLVFEKLIHSVKDNGYVYIGELHPFKQYTGSKARFETENGLIEVNCYTHHVSDYIKTANQYGFTIVLLDEFFDENEKGGLPRILSLLLVKKSKLS